MNDKGTCRFLRYRLAFAWRPANAKRRTGHSKSMKTGKRWSSWKFFPALLLALPGLLCAPGCAKDRASVGKTLMSQQSAERQVGVIDNYRVGCPDVIELAVTERPEFNGKYEVGVEG